MYPQAQHSPYEVGEKQKYHHNIGDRVDDRIIYGAFYRGNILEGRV